MACSFNPGCAHSHNGITGQWQTHWPVCEHHTAQMPSGWWTWAQTIPATSQNKKQWQCWNQTMSIRHEELERTTTWHEPHLLAEEANSIQWSISSTNEWAVWNRHPLSPGDTGQDNPAHEGLPQGSKPFQLLADNMSLYNMEAPLLLLYAGAWSSTWARHQLDWLSYALPSNSSGYSSDWHYVNK